MARTRGNARESILDAAEALVHERGTGHLTLDAVARQAGLSKGGLLYHFPSKEALLKGMITRQLAQFDRDRAAFHEGPPEDPHASLVAHLRATFAESEENRRFCAAMLAAVTNQPDLLEPAHAFHRAGLRLFAKSPLGFDRMAVLWLAATGLWFVDLLQISLLSAVERRRVTKRILKMAMEGF